MANSKATKKALFMSMLSLLLCFTMLMGATFAWFTDTVTSKNNIIKSGTLDVEMYWADGTKAVPTVDTDWTDASTGAIFDHKLWEPGYVDVKHIKIANVGSLALKYQLTITANGELDASGVQLADVIDVYYLDPADQVPGRSALTDDKKLGTLSQVLGNLATTAYGELTAGEAHTVTLALKMQESATNEYQDKSFGTDFSVVLMATQLDSEFDSFDNKYDEIPVPEKHEVVIDGNTYYQLSNGDFVLASVPYGNVGATFTVPEDVTILGQGDVYEGAVPVFSKSSPIETITLPEGLKEIKARAITGVKTLTSINFPTTLKAIRAQALRQTGMDELNIPANVEFIGDGAFRDMANLTTVTVKGNVAFENYAFRSCPNLTSIYLLGDDVTFSGSQFATHSDNGDATGMTIYVKNATVAARVYAAQTSAYGYEVKILGTAADGSDAQEVSQVKNNTELDTAISGGTSTVVLGNGNYIIPDSAKGKTLTIVGNGNTVVATQDDGSYEGCDYSLDGATVTFEGVTINTDSTTYTGYARCKGTYNNCTINGTYTLYDESVFNNCKFNVTGDVYNIWTWGAPTAEFNDCTFNNDGKAVLLYGTVNTKLTMNSCIFNDKGGLTDLKAAIEIGDDYGKSYELIVNNATVNGYEINDKGINTGTTLWANKNSMSTDKLNVVVDGVDVY
ncbi:MAG: leucine-rich repeat domain-containing protein [Ruminococcaceae bacterium]|nr:leucine-rich repeat domain-containing protein [Oscillospiraceae bacterium]